MSNSDVLPRFDETARPVWKFEKPSAPNTPGLGQRLIEIHDQIREETRKLALVVADVIQGREPADAARSALKALSLSQSYPGLGGFCSGYCQLLTVHHTMEDRQVFPGLGAIHSGLAPVLKQLFKEHEVIAELIRMLDETLAGSASDKNARAHLEMVSAGLAEQLLSHLAYEEAQLVEVLDSSPGPAVGGPGQPQRS